MHILDHRGPPVRFSREPGRKAIFRKSSIPLRASYTQPIQIDVDGVLFSRHIS